MVNGKSGFGNKKLNKLNYIIISGMVIASLLNIEKFLKLGIFFVPAVFGYAYTIEQRVFNLIMLILSLIFAIYFLTIREWVTYVFKDAKEGKDIAKYLIERPFKEYRIKSFGLYIYPIFLLIAIWVSFGFLISDPTNIYWLILFVLPLSSLLYYFFRVTQRWHIIISATTHFFDLLKKQNTKSKGNKNKK